MPTFKINPHQETPVTVVNAGASQLRFAYARSADTRAHDEPGQDFLAFTQTDDEIIFAVCDGVSQSFFGDLAAGFLAPALVGWLAQLKTSQKHQLRQLLGLQLKEWTKEAMPLIANQTLPAGMPTMQKEVLEQKRQQGSEATFVCGRILLPSEKHPKGWLLLAWMGDSRLRLTGADTELTSLLGDVFETNQRWSSRRGAVGGEVNVFVASLEGIHTVFAYTDGLKRLDTWRQVPDDFTVDQLILEEGQSPLSDDIAFVEIRLLHPVEGTFPPAPLPAPQHLALTADGNNTLTWEPVPGASYYQVVCLGEKTKTFQAPTPGWALPEEKQTTPIGVRVRAVFGITPGEWSERVEVMVQPTRRPVAPPRKPETPARPAFRPVWLVAFLVIGCFFVVGGGLALRALILPTPTHAIPSPTPVRERTPRPSPTVSPFPSSTPLSPTITPLSQPWRATLYPSATPDPLFGNLPLCYIVAPEITLDFQDAPGGDRLGSLLSGTLVQATGNITRTSIEGQEYIWLEIQVKNNYVWVQWKSTDELLQFLIPCP